MLLRGRVLLQPPGGPGPSRGAPGRGIPHLPGTWVQLQGCSFGRKEDAHLEVEVEDTHREDTWRPRSLQMGSVAAQG